jgi:hypothetical protein
MEDSIMIDNVSDEERIASLTKTLRDVREQANEYLDEKRKAEKELKISNGKLQALLRVFLETIQIK